MRYSIRGATGQEVEAAGGQKVKGTKRLGMVFADLTREQASRLEARGAVVRKVERVQPGVVPAITPPVVTPPMPIEALPLFSPAELKDALELELVRGLTSPQPYGEGFNVAVIGSGIRDTHELIRGRVVYKKNYTSDPAGDIFDHDTGVTSIILTLAPLCNILDMKVLGDDGEGTDESVVLAIDDICDMHDTEHEYAPLVINMSLGTVDTGDPDEPLRVACREAINRNILIFAAAGNSGPYPGSIFSPACERHVFAVGSVNPETGDISTFSGRGPTKEGLTKPDALMYGEHIVVAGSSSDRATVPKSGTSFSSPFLAGFAIMCRQGASIMWGESPGEPEEVTPKLIEEFWPAADLIDYHLQVACIKPEGAPAGKDNTYGYGLPYAPLALEKMGLVRPAIDISGVIGVLIPLMVIGMLGMAMGTMAKGFK